MLQIIDESESRLDIFHSIDQRRVSCVCEEEDAGNPAVPKIIVIQLG